MFKKLLGWGKNLWQKVKTKTVNAFNKVKKAFTTNSIVDNALKSVNRVKDLQEKIANIGIKNTAKTNSFEEALLQTQTAIEEAEKRLETIKSERLATLENLNNLHSQMRVRINTFNSLSEVAFNNLNPNQKQGFNQLIDKETKVLEEIRKISSPSVDEKNLISKIRELKEIELQYSSAVNAELSSGYMVEAHL